MERMEVYENVARPFVAVEDIPIEWYFTHDDASCQNEPSVFKSSFVQENSLRSGF